MIMKTKYGDYLFIIDKTNIGFLLRVATLGGVSVVELKLSIKTLEMLINLIEMVALGTEGSFVYIPMSDPTCRYVWYMFRRPFEYNTVFIKLYKQPINGDHDITIFDTETNVDSGEIDNLFSMFLAIQK